jgi:hypothetical protein
MAIFGYNIFILKLVVGYIFILKLVVNNERKHDSLR